ncbi:MAG: MFS transporter [Candidatus Xenobiia bacterium LiM19]
MSGSKSPVIFRNVDFLLLWVGQCLSQAGTRMYQIAIVWWILSFVPGGGGKELGLFLVMGVIPSIVLVKWIGSVVDRTRSKPVLVASDAAAFVIVAIIGWALQHSLLTVPAVYLAGLLVAVTEAFFNPTINKAVAEIVDENDIESAVAFQSSTQYLASFGGAVAGAVLISKIGIPAVIYLNAASYLISAAVNQVIRFRHAIPPQSGDAALSEESGWSILKDFPVLKKVLLGFGFVNFFATPTLVILPVYTKLTLHADAAVLGALEASLWIGLLVGSFASSWFSTEKGTIRLGAICLFVLGLGLFLPGLIINQLFYMAMLVIAGIFLGVNNVKFVSLFQCVVDPSIKGRFFAIMNALISFTFPVAYFLFGVLADLILPSRVALIQGGGVMLVALYFGSLARFEPELAGKKDDGEGKEKKSS